MVWAVPAAIALGLCFSANLGKAAAATLIMGAVQFTAEQHPDLSASLLEGFPCIPASDLPAATILAFAQGLQSDPAELSAAQLSCLASLLAAKNLTADFSQYPPDLLLFFDLDELDAGTCKAFYARASRGNLELLPRGSAQRAGLLHGALTCLGVRSSHLHPEQLSSLGGLVCDMEPETITASDPGVLENLKLCPALTGAQRDALNTVLLRAGTAYGDPSSWDLQTLQNLGPLVLALNQTTLSLVAEAVREAFVRSIVAAYGSQERSQREKSLTILRTLTASSRPRLKRNAGRCLYAPITASTVSDPLLLIDYDTVEQFDLCMSSDVVKTSLKALLEQPLTMAYIRVVRKKLDQAYPSGLPDEQLKLLGSLSRLYTPEEISRWWVTSSDTLSVLLNPMYGKWGDAQIQQLIRRYLDLGGSLTGPLLQKIGGKNLCNLQEEDIKRISPEAIRTAGRLNVSSCSQTKKDQLYQKAREAFAGQAGSPGVYLCRIGPYLGGAPVQDLKDLAEVGVTINITTFLALNPDELQKLSVTDVKNLLGENLPYLKDVENEPSVMHWVQRQSQRELDCVLGIGLQGGTVPSPQPPTSASVTPTATVPAPTTLPTVPTPIAISSHPTAHSSTGPHKVPTPSLTPPGTDTPVPSTTGSPPVTSTAQPAPTTGPIVPCSIHPAVPSSTATPPAVTLLSTILATVKPNATSPSSVPPPAVTHSATTTSVVPNSVVTTHKTSTLLVSSNPPAPGGTIHPAPATPNTVTPSTHSAPSTLVPHSPSAHTEVNPSPQPTPSPHSTQKNVVSSTAETTTLDCMTGAPPASPSPSSTNTASETGKKTTTGAPQSPGPTSTGIINLTPEPGSGSHLSPCLVSVLMVAVGTCLLRGLL
ncbi:mesothelin-like protein [Patagioenas fasciata monilis]|uniref:Mesothelin-like protein n=1 Tax=Patagioenas fasciata monilis TaxID=372326 RepID=A0A1V4KSK2_PATFA|nr:mesothelin-like protein [Patagioenas fasciata monilis]